MNVAVHYHNALKVFQLTQDGQVVFVRLDELVDLNAAIAQAVRDSAPSDQTASDMASGAPARPIGIAAGTASREGAERHLHSVSVDSGFYCDPDESCGAA